MKARETTAVYGEILTVEELASYLKINAQTVYRRFRAGDLPGVRIGRSIRFPRSLVDAWLRLRATGWDEERRQGLFGRLREHAAKKGLRESDVVAVVKRRRRSG
ncbi:MAG: helix-turn-helix domain-containing protein [Planctomycetes bacterium]|nr:helix-turn-helix domain-containing protein [Planctomycetota bacterium]